MNAPIWLMDSECCCRCGAILDVFETTLCTDCLHGAWYAEEQERWDAWFDDEETPTIGTPEEAYAVDLSLTDEDVGRLEREEQQLDIKDT